MARDIDQENSEVRTLILNTLQAEERAMESDQDSMDSRSEYDEMDATYDVNEKYNPENDDEQIDSYDTNGTETFHNREGNRTMYAYVYDDAKQYV